MKELDEILNKLWKWQMSNNGQHAEPFGIEEAKAEIEKHREQWALSKLQKKKRNKKDMTLSDVLDRNIFNQAITQAEKNIKEER